MRLIATRIVSACKEPSRDSGNSPQLTPNNWPKNPRTSSLGMLLPSRLSVQSPSNKSPRLLKVRSCPKYMAMHLGHELKQRVPALPAPRDGCTYHVYCSPHNASAAELMHEVAREQPGFNVLVTQSIDELHSCERMLIYLTSLTWTSGETSNAFAQEVCGSLILLNLHELQCACLAICRCALAGGTRDAATHAATAVPRDAGHRRTEGAAWLRL
jgi:hypothetical protein